MQRTRLRESLQGHLSSRRKLSVDYHEALPPDDGTGSLSNHNVGPGFVPGLERDSEADDLHDGLRGSFVQANRIDRSVVRQESRRVGGYFLSHRRQRLPDRYHEVAPLDDGAGGSSNHDISLGFYSPVCRGSEADGLHAMRNGHRGSFVDANGIFGQESREDEGSSPRFSGGIASHIYFSRSADEATHAVPRGASVDANRLTRGDCRLETQKTDDSFKFEDDSPHHTHGNTSSPTTSLDWARDDEGCIHDTRIFSSDLRDDEKTMISTSDGSSPSFKSNGGGDRQPSTSRDITSSSSSYTDESDDELTDSSSEDGSSSSSD